MSEIEKEKLGFKEKLLGAIGKRVMWWRAKKANKLLFHLGFAYTFLELYNLTKSIEKSLKIMSEMGLEAGKDLMYESLSLAKPILSRQVSDLKVILESSWYAFLGKEKLSYFEYFPPDEQGIEKIVWRANHCMLCSQLKEDILFLEQVQEITDFNTKPAGVLLCSIFESFFSAVMDAAGLKFNVSVEETKCMHIGDLYQEFTASFIPK